MKRKILYFTGTGNCLYVARRLSDADTELLSVPQLVKRGIYDIEADEIGLVYPIYGHMPPTMVREYLAKAALRADYKFAVLTFGCRKCNAVEILRDYLDSIGKPFDYVSTVMMVDNWLPNFDMDVQKKMDKHIPEQLTPIQDDIRNRRKWYQPVSDEERSIHEGFLELSGLDPAKGWEMRSEQYFASDDRCIKCGVCVGVCPRGNWSLGKEKAGTEGDCDFCFACIQNCPTKAIGFLPTAPNPLLAKGEVNRDARYRNPHVTVDDIKKSNNRH